MRKNYQLDDYQKLLESLGLLKEACLFGKDQEKVTDLTFNSKEVTPGTLYICKGMNFKEAYLTEALEKGAVCYVSEIPYPNEQDVPHLLVSDIRKAMPYLADLCFESPWKELKTVWVGGTKGKTTTVYYVKSIVDAYLSDIGGKESALSSTIDSYDGERRWESLNSTPEAVQLQAMMRRAADHGITHMEIEVSSQALKYDRVTALRANVGIFVNISEDHISPNEHQDFEDYFTS
ncbi:MAG: UDP-N-acetylmuramoyl-L-alanyl-D-glutamate--2,6-diaminopimelate ligase, partial [Firmicutes bacterium]|nr:UDP-N-acetylmuramoyl-L-alanyl-D-glutamate--2,6-diaminopimelate ligase [Bacillota bacterium]